MSSVDEARQHVQKAEEYLRSARLVLTEGFTNAACSLAITSGINSKDAICLGSLGLTSKSDDHGRAVDELRRSGATGASMAPTLSRLLAKKSKSQYASTSISLTDAQDAVRRAERLWDAARDVLRDK